MRTAPQHPAHLASHARSQGQWVRAIGLACLLSLAALGSCGGGGGGDKATPAVTAGTTTTVRTLNCTADARVTRPEGGLLFNNTWNSAAAGQATWEQCLIARTTAAGVNQYGWRWTWPSAGGALFAYPEIVVGAKPWEAGPGNDSRFPIRIAQAQALRLRYTTETQAIGSRNLATSLWLIQTPEVASPPVESDITAELMIWSDYTDDMVADPGTTTLRGTFTDANGLQWDIWADTNWGDASGGSTHRWTYIAYIIQPGQRRQSADIDALAMLRHAASLGLISTSLYVADVELGNELVAGQGETWLTEFALTVN
ncbi:hypothetical protein [Aquabacterium sp.]|uniref:hypothetical protein n=1 Tax=Aquabacterium sp. TaxID=1872578 RepID=UPI0025C58C75|nr:hypothetical protein [Aquabacterium sp.]